MDAEVGEGDFLEAGTVGSGMTQGPPDCDCVQSSLTLLHRGVPGPEGTQQRSSRKRPGVG